LGLTALDTCVLARYIVRDDARQGEIAEQRVAGGGYIALTVLLELVWLLRSRYRYTRALVADTLDDLLCLPGLVFADEAGVAWAATQIRAGADPADVFHLIASRSQDSFSTFDDMARAVGKDAPVAINLLR
jgi:predicted nucleic-acid-binding protein